MSIINNPIALDSTAKSIISEMDRENALLSAYLVRDRAGLYTNITQFSQAIRSGTVEQNAALFPVGDQILIPWKDVDSSNHNTDENAYMVHLDIVHHGLVTLESGTEVPGVFLQWHHCTPYGVQFSHQQAFMNCPDGLAAGTYIVELAQNWGSNAVGGSRWAFTLTQNVPAGGRLSGFDYMPDYAPSTWKVKTWATPDAADPIETVSVAEVSEETVGTDLGVMPYNNPDEENGLNCMQSVGYGHNRWKTSAVRQYLNSSGANWWKSQEDYDIRPDQYTKNGFMTGFSEEFLAAIKPVKVQTALNTVEGFAETTDITYDRFFLPSLEQMYVNPQIKNVEGEYWEYWRRRLGASAPVAQYGTYPNLITTGIDNPNAAQSVRLRSASRGNSYGTWFVYTSGGVSGSGACGADRFSPVCVIC